MGLKRRLDPVPYTEGAPMPTIPSSPSCWEQGLCHTARLLEQAGASPDQIAKAVSRLRRGRNRRRTAHQLDENAKKRFSLLLGDQYWLGLRDPLFN